MDFGATGSPAGRAAVNDGPDGLELVIPAPRIWPLIGFLLLWLAGWAAGESFALRQVLMPAPAGARAFLGVWLAFWTLGGGFAISACAWMIGGHERVRLGTDALTLRLEVLGLGPTRRYALDRVTRLRAPAFGLDAEVAASAALQTALARAQARGRTISLDPRPALKVVGIAGPGITFEYDGKPVRFGLALDPAEAALLVTQLRARHAFVDSPER